MLKKDHTLSQEVIQANKNIEKRIAELQAEKSSLQNQKKNIDTDLANSKAKLMQQDKKEADLVSEHKLLRVKASQSILEINEKIANIDTKLENNRSMLNINTIQNKVCEYKKVKKVLTYSCDKRCPIDESLLSEEYRNVYVYKMIPKSLNEFKVPIDIHLECPTCSKENRINRRVHSLMNDCIPTKYEKFKFNQPKSEIRSLMLLGKSRIGKTTYSLDIAFKCIEADLCGARFVREDELDNKYVINFDGLLIVDDLCYKSFSGFKEENYIEKLSDFIYTRIEERGLPTIFTSNMTPNALRERIGDRLFYRISENCEIKILGEG